MAFSPQPSEFLYSVSSSSLTSQHFFLLKFDSNYNSVSFKSVRAQRVQIICSNEALRLEGTRQDMSPEKKTRKLKPSFLEQVQKKWSLRVPSSRENLPWQEHQSDIVNHVPIQSEVLPNAERGIIKSSCSVGERAVADSYTISKSILAPWAHGNRLNKKLLNLDVAEKQEEQVVQKKQRHHVPLSSNDPLVGGYENLKEVTGGEEKADEFVSRVSSVGFLEKDVIFATEDCQDKIFSDDRDITHAANANDAKMETRLRSRNTKSAERLIPELELKRLRNISLRMMERIKVGAAGVTKALVDSIHDKWRYQELVKLKFEGHPSENMKRTHQILESRTGGVIIWRSGSLVVLYRGITYNLDCVNMYREQADSDSGALVSLHQYSSETIEIHSNSGDSKSSGLHKTKAFNNRSQEEQVDLNEINLVLDELGPRFTDWQGRDPIPVDADLLPAIVPGYKTPFRLVPYGTRLTLRDSEMTFLRRTARNLPPHFVLGRNRGLQGLAASMVKLWEKSAIAVIVIKRGVLNTHNERMAEELKILTGGTLLSRNKEFIIFYRGNDFLPPGVSSALTEVEKRAALCQDAEENTRNIAAMPFDHRNNASQQPLVAGTLAETLAATSLWGSNNTNSADVEKMMRDSSLAKRASNLSSLQWKLVLAKDKVRKAEKALQKVLSNREPENLPTDLEILTNEERAVLRRIGLSMKPYLLLGRREIFDGTIENMHLHWKYRELVKIIVKWKTIAQVKHIAISLEAESGGVLVSVEKTPKGHAIIVYRGKNYQRPLTFRPKTLLTRRQALARSIELQRREGLRHHILELEDKVEKLKEELDMTEQTSAREDAIGI